MNHFIFLSSRIHSINVTSYVWTFLFFILIKLLMFPSVNDTIKRITSGWPYWNISLALTVNWMLLTYLSFWRIYVMFIVILFQFNFCLYDNEIILLNYKMFLFLSIAIVCRRIKEMDINRSNWRHHSYTRLYITNWL